MPQGDEGAPGGRGQRRAETPALDPMTAATVIESLDGHVVLCGLTGLGKRTLEELALLGEDVVAIATDPGSDLRSVEGTARAVIEGPARDPRVLELAGVRRAHAIIFTDDDDVGNIDAALAALELNRRMRIVVRIFDPDFGHRIEALFPDCVSLSASALAAPGFVSAILEEGLERRIEILGRWFAVRRAPIDARDVLLPLGRATEEGDLEPFPTEGSDVLCLVDPGGGSHGEQHHARRRRRLRAVRTGVSALRLALAGDRRLGYLLAVFLALTFVSALMFSAVAGIGVVEALFNTTSAFFGGVDATVARRPEIALLSVVLTFVGAGAVAALYALLADAVLETRLSQALGPTTKDMKDHVVICGLGTIGFGVASQLRQLGVDVAAAELSPDGRFLGDARALGIPVVTADARQPETFRALALDRARCLLAATDSDGSNLQIALLARATRPDLRVVVRLFDVDLAARVERVLGTFISRSSSTLAAPAFAAAALGRRVLATIPIGRRVLVVAQVPIEAGSALDGATVAQANAVGECRVLGVVDGDVVDWELTPDETLQAARSAIVVGSRRGLSDLILQAVEDSANRGWSVGYAIIRR